MKTSKSISRMTSVLILFIVLVTGVPPAQAQATVTPLSSGGDFIWAKGIGGTGLDKSDDIAVDASGDVYMTGGFEGTVDFDPGSGTTNLTSTGGTDIFISKLDTDGNLLWAKSLTGVDYEEAFAITVDPDGNVYTTGKFSGTADFDPGVGAFNLIAANEDIFVSKLDSNGNFIWAKQLGSGEGDSIAVDSTGNVYTTGFGTGDFDPGPGVFKLTSLGGDDIFISKLDSNGNFGWATGMTGNGNDFGSDIAVDPSGNVYTSGSFENTVDFDPGPSIFNLNSAGFLDMFLSKLDTDGNLVWAKRTGGTGADYGLNIALDSTGNIYSTGRFRGTVDFNPGAGILNLTSAGGFDIFLSKLDASGNLLWAKGMGESGFDEGRSLAVDSGGSVYIGGKFENTVDFDPSAGTFNLTSAGTGDVFAAKFGNHGNFIWAKGMGGVNDEFSPHIAVDASKNIFAAGGFSGTADFDPGATPYNLSSAGSYDIFVTKLDHDTVLSRDTTGVFRPSNGIIFLKNSNTTGIADVGLNYGLPGDYPVVGDWDGNGTVTIGIYRGHTFFLRNENTIGFATIVFDFGQTGDQPIAGDWNGDGIDTIGIFRPLTAQFLLRNSNDAGPADSSFVLGNPGDVGIAGDWNGDGKDTTGVFRPSNGVIFLKNSNDTGIADYALNYGLPGDKPVMGDWDNDGIDTIGVYRNAQFMLRNSNTIGFAEIIFGLGNPGDMPIAGNWDGQP